MTVYCPACGGTHLMPQHDPIKIDEEVDQVLYQQLEHCENCQHEFVDKWWLVWDVEGSYTVDVNNDGTLGKRGRDPDAPILEDEPEEWGYDFSDYD